MDRLGRMQAAGFAQHYGLPTEFLDLTASLAVATAFAIGDPEEWTSPKRVSFAVLDMRRAVDTLRLSEGGPAQCRNGEGSDRLVDLRYGKLLCEVIDHGLDEQ